jgi:hypothetical protein
MTELRLGPVLRYVGWDGTGTATVWLETEGACTAEVRCADGAFGSMGTFEIAGHHYALVEVAGLTPGTSTTYEVRLDGHRVWPQEDSPFPPSSIRTPIEGAVEARVSFGSCRWAAPAKGRSYSAASATSDPRPGTPSEDDRQPTPQPKNNPRASAPDALDTLALKLAVSDKSARPDVLLLVGDQVYADETSPRTQSRLARHRDLSVAPGTEVADYEEYTHLYEESWGDPEVRWLLSTVPSCMVFDDHDVIDDWNTSEAWLTEIRTTSWWEDRILGGLMSYWVYQHLGNLSPAELAGDELYKAVREGRAEGQDGTAALREFAARADHDNSSVRWSYRRDFGRTRLVVVDSRGARVLAEDRRAMVDEAESLWVREQVLDGAGSYDHLLVGTSLPWLLPPFIHDLESWDSVLCGGGRGARWIGERLRRKADLEHWAAFPRSFEQLADLLAEVGTGTDAPATICVLSGDVHHAYIAEASWPGGRVDSRVVQLTCSPVHNSVPGYMKVTFRVGWNGVGKLLGRALKLHGGLGRSSVEWDRTGGPWFGNQLMTLTLHGRRADLRLDQSRSTSGGSGRKGILGAARSSGSSTGGAELVAVDERVLSDGL